MENTPNKNKLSPKLFLGVYFEKCKVYGRLYKNHNQTAYTGFCPKCAQSFSVPIGSQGTNNRFFVASCYLT